MEQEQISCKGISTGDRNNLGGWIRSNSNTPSPTTSLGSVGSTDHSSSSDPNTNTHQPIPSHFPKPFWKKRYCEDSNELCAQQTSDDSQQINNSNEAKVNAENHVTIDRNCITFDEKQHQRKRRKIHRYIEDASFNSNSTESSNDAMRSIITSMSCHFNADANTSLKRGSCNDNSPRSSNIDD